MFPSITYQPGRSRVLLAGALLGLAGSIAPAVSLSATPALQQSQDNRGTLRATVTGAAGAPLLGVVVVAQPRGTAAGAQPQPRNEARSLKTGVATLALAPGEYTLTVQALGFRVESRAITVAPDQTVSETFALTAVPTTLAQQVVTATRTSTALRELPSAVSVVGKEEVSRQSQVSSGLAEVLGKAVPGLSAGSQSGSNSAQSLRGRNVSVLIDGVPLSTNRNVLHDFTQIDPAAIERVEVVRGASAIYGDGATGGVINIITRSGDPSAPRLQFSTDIQGSGASSKLKSSESVKISQRVSGAARGFDYLFNGVYGKLGGFFDAEGDRIPPDPQGQGGIADTRTISGLGKLGWSLPRDQRLQLTVSHHDMEQDTRYVLIPSTSEKKAVVRPGFKVEKQPNSKNTQASLNYRNPSLFGNAAHVQLYTRDYITRFGPATSRVARREPGDVAPVTRDYPRSSFVDSRKSGGRAEFETRFDKAMKPSITWGFDYVREHTFQGLDIYDRDIWRDGDSLVYVKVDEWKWVPPMTTSTWAGFAQLAVQPMSRWTVRGGLRHERASVNFKDFETIAQVPVTGGTIRYRPVVFNLGTVVNATNAVDLFANFSQGFSLSDLGRVLRAAPAGFTIQSASMKASRVDQYELGMRGAWSRLQSTMSLFRNTSEFGSTFDANLGVIRAPERIYGAELTVDAQPTNRISLGGTASLTEGEAFVRRDTLSTTDSVWKALGGNRIQPAKLTVYAQHQTFANWSNRIQVLYSAKRHRAYDDQKRYAGAALTGTDMPLEAFATVDFVSTLRVGPGTLTVGAENLLNRQYYTVYSQLNSGVGQSQRAAARGRVMTVGYAVSY